MQTIARKRVQSLRQSFHRSVRLVMLSGRGEKPPQIARIVDARVEIARRNADVAVTDSIPHFGQRPSTGESMTNERVPAMMDGKV